MLRDGDERDYMLMYYDDVDEDDEGVCDAQCLHTLYVAGTASTMITRKHTPAGAQ